MPWTWHTDNFTRSDRALHRDLFAGAGPARWQVYVTDSSGGDDAAAHIVSNAPRAGATGDPGDASGSWLMADLADFTSDPILGVGVQALFASLGTPLGSAYFGDLFAGFPALLEGEGIMTETDNSTTSNYRLAASSRAGATRGRMSVGSIGGLGGISSVDPRTVSSSVLEDYDEPANIAKWNPGDVVRLEVTFGGSIELFYNGALVRTIATPAAVTGTLVGVLISRQWNVDDVAVGALT